MNNFRWNNRFFNRRRQNAFGLLANRNRGRGMLFTLLGLGAGVAAWLGLNRGRSENNQQAIQNMFSNAQRSNSRSQAAFAEELLPEITSEKNSKE